MQRRTVLRSLAVGFSGLMSLPAWASGWTADSLEFVSTLPLAEEALLAEIVETFIPQTTMSGVRSPSVDSPSVDSPGAKSLGVHQFAMRMIQDCYGPPAQETLQRGLVLTEDTAQKTAGKPFTACDAPQRIAILTALTTNTDPVGKAFVDLVKGLTIQGYTNSEYYLVNVKKYVMAPGYYHGCVEVPEVASKNGR